MMMPTNRNMTENQAGFTLVEVLIAMVILSGGLLALAASFAPGMAVINGAYYHQIAKQKASESVESVFTARDSLLLEWDNIRNINDGGIFLDGTQNLKAAGADGLINTADDGAVETITLPNGNVVSLLRFSRQIEIVDAPGDNGGMLRQITVTIRYPVGPYMRQYQLRTYISAYA
jgi:prepilin-type N-terminal cleavage/methylation domain-containing protein